MDRQGRMEKKNKTSGTARYGNIDTLYINEKILFLLLLRRELTTWNGSTVKNGEGKYDFGHRKL